MIHSGTVIYLLKKKKNQRSKNTLKTTHFTLEKQTNKQTISSQLIRKVLLWGKKYPLMSAENLSCSATFHPISEFHLIFPRCSSSHVLESSSAYRVWSCSLCSHSSQASTPVLSQLVWNFTRPRCVKKRSVSLWKHLNSWSPAGKIKEDRGG